jgi:hypothetical protein
MIVNNSDNSTNMYKTNIHLTSYIVPEWTRFLNDPSFKLFETSLDASYHEKSGSCLGTGTSM